MLLMTAAAKHFSTFPPSSSLASSAFHGFGVANSLISEDFDDLIEEEGEKLVFLHRLATLHAVLTSFIFMIRRWLMLVNSGSALLSLSSMQKYRKCVLA